MMTKKRASGRTQVETQETTLSPLEEKVVRMRHGLAAPNTLKLEHKGGDDPELVAELTEIERRALAAVGPRSNREKRRIVSALRRKT